MLSVFLGKSPYLIRDASMQDTAEPAEGSLFKGEVHGKSAERLLPS